MNQMKDEFERFYQGRTVLITGHMGFKGAWLCKILSELGAKVVGYSLGTPTEPSLFALANIEQLLCSNIGDIRNLNALQKVFESAQPEIVIHMAAQPLVRESYKNPVDTYETNVMGTVNLLECVRMSSSVKSVVNVTTDKVYRNNEWNRGYVEIDYLDGYDPYSNSKSCSELVTHSYTQSFLAEKGIAVSTCRAGNVIGGGDFARDRIVPDCVRAALSKQDILVRNPNSIRPYQHVLEPLFVYLMIAMRQYWNPKVAGSYNVGPEETSCVTTEKLVSLFCSIWNEQVLESSLRWINQSDGGPHEANFLKLDCTKLKSTFNWRARWSIEKAIEQVVLFEEIRLQMIKNSEEKLLAEQLQACMKKQIEQYFY